MAQETAITQVLQSLAAVPDKLRKESQRHNGDRHLDMELQDLEKPQAERDEVNWVTAIFMSLFHVGAIAALFFFTWKALFVAMFLWWVSTTSR